LPGLDLTALVADDLPEVNLLGHVLQQVAVFRLALLQFPEQDVLGLGQAGFNNGKVNQIERNDLEEMAYRAHYAEGISVQGKGQTGGNGQEDRSREPPQHSRIK
jgi:hypothetical protein